MKGAGSLRTLSRIAQYVRSQNVDVIHTLATRAVYMGLAAGVLTRRPVVASVHIVSHDIVYTRLLPRGANQIVTVSNFVRDVLLNHGAPPSRLQTIYPGTYFPKEYEPTGGSPASYTAAGEIESDAPDVARNVRAELCLAPSAQLVGMFGYYSALKGQTLLMQAAAAIAVSCPRAHFILWETYSHMTN